MHIILSISLREIKIKTTPRFHLPPIRIDEINNIINNNTNIGENVKKGNPSFIVAGFCSTAGSLEIHMESPQNAKVDLPQDPAYTQRTQHFTSHVHCYLIHNSQEMQSIQCQWKKVK